MSGTRQSLASVIAPLRPDRIAAAETLIDALGNPASEAVRAALEPSEDGFGTHFCSLHALRSRDRKRGYLVLEVSADGTDEEALRRLANALGTRLRPVLMLASDWTEGDLLAYLQRHLVAAGAGLFSSPGVSFAGTPGLSVGRIRAEAALAGRIAPLLHAQPLGLSAQARLRDVRDRLGDDLEAPPPRTPFAPPSIASLAGQLVWSFTRTYLWPLGIVFAVAAVLGASLAQGGAAARLISAWHWIVITALSSIPIGLVLALDAYLALRRAEATDATDDLAPDYATVQAIFDRENRALQNHMVSVTQRKPGALRWLTLRLIFWVIGELAGRFYRPGFLSDIGTIHFARWVTAPGSPDLFFFSNYDNSWESYLEDFITRAHAGLTGIWSNTIGFPRSENLIGKGATDGERFKRFARRSMVPTRFWYSACPDLSTTAIRTNTQIREGLSGAMSEDEAVRWLALFGSAPRPAAKLISSEIQSLIFGGLGFMPFGTCMLIRLPDRPAAARDWLGAVLPSIAFNDGRRLRHPAVATVSLSAGGLTRLGLPDAGLRSFPFAFLEGMTAPHRGRLLGDVGHSAPDGWCWGADAPDAALLVYGRTPQDVEQMRLDLERETSSRGGTVERCIPLLPVGDSKTEPFGFADGIAQPVIRGTYKGLRSADPIHLVEPGEFILGYPDNRGNRPPGPTLPALADPENRLPLVDAGVGFGRTTVDGERDLGQNGSFLVVRQLEQDVTAFADYCEAQAKDLAGRFPEPYVVSPEFIGAKLVGRWTDGSSLVRNPYESYTASRRRHAGAKEQRKQQGLAVTAEPEDAAMERPKSSPASGHQLDPPLKPNRRVDDDFLYGTEDPEALRCPFGAHIRRANPRESTDPGSADQIAITNRHRILRVGRQYEPHEGQKPGLLFMCLNGDIERQFEFVQQTWLGNPAFHGLSGEADPLTGGAARPTGFTIPTRDGPVGLKAMPSFVIVKGGGYFFVPGKRLLEFLATPL